MRTRRIKLQVENPAGITFWLLLFQDREALKRYARRRTGEESPTDGLACCITDAWEQQVMICLPADSFVEGSVAHEAFHAACWYARLAQGWPFKKGSKAVRINDTTEETLAQCCGAVYQEIWYQLRTRYELSMEQGEDE